MTMPIAQSRAEELADTHANHDALFDAAMSGEITQAEYKAASRVLTQRMDAAIRAALKPAKPTTARVIMRGEAFGKLGTIATSDMVEVEVDGSRPIRHTARVWRTLLADADVIRAALEQLPE